MGVDVNAAYSQATNLASYANSDLTRVVNNLVAYKGIITASWQATEVGHISIAIDQAIAQIYAASKSLNEISSDVRTSADVIKREEEAEAARLAEEERKATQEREAAQQRQAQAQKSKGKK